MLLGWQRQHGVDTARAPRHCVERPRVVLIVLLPIVRLSIRSRITRYADVGTSTIGETDLPMSVEQWTSVLVLASQWHFSSLRDYAIYRLEKITTPAQRISLAKTQHIPKWLVPAYIELCSQKAPLDRSDARLLGLDDVLAIWEVQHELARGPLYEDGEVRQLVEAKITGLGEKGESTSPALTLVNGFGEHAGTGSTGIARMPPSDTFVHVVGPASSNHGLPVDVLAPTPSAFNLPLTEISPHPHGEHEAAPSVPDKPSAVFLSTAPTTHVNAETTISLSLSTPQALPSTLPSTPDSPPRAPLSPDHVRQPPHAFSRTQSPDSLGPSPSSTPTTMFSMTPLGLVPRRVAGPERQQGRANGQGNNNKPSQTLASATERRAPGAAAVKQAALSAKKRKKAAGAKGTSTGLAA